MKRAVRVGNRTIEYTLIQSVRKNMLFKALPDGATWVYAPKTMRLRDIDETVRQNVNMLDKMHADLDREIAAETREHPMREGAVIMVEGQPHVLHLHDGVGQPEIRDGEIHLWGRDLGDEETARAILRSALANLALQRIRERLAYYAPKVGGTYYRVTIREQKTRWGSCSSKHNLNFNWKLIMAPPQVLDYVVIHELCHLHEFNHSERFWKLVERQMPEYEAWKKWLKVHGQELTI